MPQREPDNSRRAPLTRERVIEAAMDLADAEGLGALTMRRLATELGVEAMTLYYHVANKEEILNAIADAVVAEFELPGGETDWKQSIRTTALTAYDSLSRHPWAASLTLSLKRAAAPRLRYMDHILGTLKRAGFSEEMTDRGYHAIEGHIMGFTLWEVGMNLPGRTDLRDLASSFLRELPAEEYPHVAEHVEHHLRERPSSAMGAFEFGLELILDGLERNLQRG